MTHRPNAITHTQEYTVLPGVARHTFIIFSLFTTPYLCPPPRHKILATPLTKYIVFTKTTPLLPGRCRLLLDQTSILIILADIFLKDDVLK